MPEVLSDAPISLRARRVLEYENPAVIDAFIDDADISALRAYDVFHEMKLYLLLCTLNPGEKLPVPQEIDALLHRFLDDPGFDAFCKERAGGAIEHVPCATLGEQDLGQVLERAHARYSRHFDQRLWSRGLPTCTCTFKPS